MNELGVQGQNFVIYRPLMGIVDHGVSGPGRTRLFLHLPEGGVVPLPLLIDRGEASVFVVYAQGFAVGHAYLEMSVQVLPVLAPVQRLLQCGGQLLVLQASHMDGIGLVHRQGERRVLGKLDFILHQDILKRQIELFPARLIGLCRRGGQRGRSVGEGVGIAHLQVLSTMQKVKLMVIGPGPLVL